MFRILSLAWVLLFLGIAPLANGQIKCYAEKLTPTEQEELSFFIQNNQTSKTRRAQYSLAVNVVVLTHSGESSAMSQNRVDELIQRASLYFSTIGINFYLQNGTIRQVVDEPFVDFNISQEQALRQKYDRPDAINIYFVKTITMEDGSVLSGLSSLPTYTFGSNRLMFSYLDGSFDNFSILKDKTFLHELGHYFGLLHTFQDSNNERLDKRELVTRQSGANCAYTGDQLCDTPADPYERLQYITAFDCNSRYPETLQDAYGFQYVPFYDNIMSYHIRCGNVFTEQQYQRMEAGLSIRVSPTAEYRITEKDINYISVKPLNNKVFCAGQKVKIPFTQSGFFNSDNQFFVELSDPFGGNFSQLSSVLNKDTIELTLPNSLKASSKYRLRINGSAPFVEGFPSESFEVKTAGEIFLSSEIKNIDEGSSAILTVNLIGNGPWDFTLSDGRKFENIIASTVYLAVDPLESSTYSIINASGQCGVNILESAAYVNVVKPQIEIGEGIPELICSNQYFTFPVKGLKISNLDKYKVEISDGENLIETVPVFGFSSIGVKLLNLTKATKTYSLKIKGNGLGDLSRPFQVNVLPLPDYPDAQDEYNFCFGNLDNSFFDTQKNWLWYQNEFDFVPIENFELNTLEPTTKVYYIAQISKEGCLSEKKRIKIEVYERTAATLSGEYDFLQGQSVRIKIKLTGKSPWLIETVNGELISTDQPETEWEYRPENSEIFTLNSVKNECGNGSVVGQANVNLIQLLSNEFESTANEVYPNPTIKTLYVKLAEVFKNQTAINLKLYHMNGTVIFSSNYNLRNVDTDLRIDLPSLHPGVYVLELASDQASHKTRVIIK